MVKTTQAFLDYKTTDRPQIGLSLPVRRSTPHQPLGVGLIKKKALTEQLLHMSSLKVTKADIQ